MLSSLSHFLSRGGRPRTKGAAASGGSNNEGPGTLLRGALSGNIGASPFGVLATTPELPVSSAGTCVTASGTLRASPSASRHAHAGLSLRRANSSGSGSLSRTVSGGVTPGMPPISGKRGVFLRQLSAALVVLQLVLICVLLFKPSLVNELAGVVKSASVSHLASTDSRAHVQEAPIDETSTVAIVNKLAADSRRSARVDTAAASRRERMWPTSADINARQKQQQQQPQTQEAAARQQSKASSSSSSQPVRLAAIQTTSGGAVVAADIKAATVVAATSAKAKNVSVSTTKASQATSAIVDTSGDKGSTTVAAAVTTVAAPTHNFPPFEKPVVPFPGRAANAPPIVGVVFYGRRDRVRILDCYLQRNMIRNGGLLVYVVFVVATWQPQDVEFLDRLIAYRAGDYRKLYPQRLDKGYTGHYAWMDPATMYVKIDDDVVYIADHAIDHMLLAHNLHRYHLISANVINHQPLELPHSQAGAHFTYEQARPGDKSSWQPVMRPVAAAGQAKIAAGAAGGAVAKPALEPVPFTDNGWDVWGDWRRAANVHYSFLANHAAGRLGVYDFPPTEQLWDFNRHFGYTRWRINMIMFKGATIDVHVYNMSSTIDTYPGDDEDFITRILPKQLNRTSAAVSQALAVHFSFYMQRAGLENSTDLLDRYALLAERTCGRLVSASPTP